MASHPHHASGGPRRHTPRLIAWELTRSCPLSCVHCRASAAMRPFENELSTEEIQRILDNVATEHKPIIILTGGEPMLRPDLETIVRHCIARDLKPVLATCGALLTEESAGALKAWGIERISVSIDGPDAERHDAFRGEPGAFDAAMRGLAACRAAGLPFQVNATITRRNAGQIGVILERAVAEGAVAFHPFLLVPTGRGTGLGDEALDADEYETVLNRIYDLRQTSPVPFKPTCAPHYYRVLRQREEAAGREVIAETHGLDAMTRGCMGGTSFAFISHVGKVQICGFLEEEAGDLRAADYDFRAIWRDSELFAKMRSFRNYKGDCGICEYRAWCGGCRARAYAATGDYMAEEPSCNYRPAAALEAEAEAQAEGGA